MPRRFPACRQCGEKAWEPECDPERQTFLQAWVRPRGPFFVPVPCSQSISLPTRRSEIALRAAWEPPARVFYFAGYFAGKPASEGPPSFGGFDSICGCLLNGYYSI